MAACHRFFIQGYSHYCPMNYAKPTNKSNICTEIITPIFSGLEFNSSPNRIIYFFVGLRNGLFNSLDIFLKFFSRV